MKSLNVKDSLYLIFWCIYKQSKQASFFLALITIIVSDIRSNEWVDRAYRMKHETVEWYELTTIFTDISQAFDILLDLRKRSAKIKTTVHLAHSLFVLFVHKIRDKSVCNAYWIWCIYLTRVIYTTTTGMCPLLRFSLLSLKKSYE